VASDLQVPVDYERVIQKIAQRNADLTTSTAMLESALELAQERISTLERDLELLKVKLEDSEA
jgi:prefoldin subunit 5